MTLRRCSARTGFAAAASLLAAWIAAPALASPASSAGGFGTFDDTSDAIERTLSAGAEIGADLLRLAAWIAVAMACGYVVYLVVFALTRTAAAATRTGDRATDRKDRAWTRVAKRLRAPARLLFPVGFVLLTLRYAPASESLREPARHIAAIGLIVATTWLLTRAANASVAALLAGYNVGERDNLRARKVHTQFRVITRIVVVVLWVLGFAAALMTFDRVRELGASLLASAGLVGLVVGLAAQRTIGNFIAGIQIAITQPIRLDDAVVIAGEWGWIEEINATYVVVKIWDERRLIVPFNTLLEQPFQNWTRTRADLLGSVTLHVDYRAPLAQLRAELDRIVSETDLWDRRVCVLQVVEAHERTMQLRALVSAADSPTAWDLRCLVREKLIDFLQREHPESLPTLRAELHRESSPTAESRPLPPTTGPSLHDAAVSDAEVRGGLPGAPEASTAEGTPAGRGEGDEPEPGDSADTIRSS